MLMLFVAAGHLSAQEVRVEPFRTTHKALLTTDIYLYAGGGVMTDRELKLAGSESMQQGKMGCASADAGVAVMLYPSNLSYLRFNAMAGYKYQTHNFTGKATANAGIDAHWLSMDVGAEFGRIAGIGLGVRTDVLMNSHVRSNNQFVYEGLYADCFNRVALSGYYGFHVELYRIRLEYRMGMYFIPHLDPQRVAYYNHTTTRTGGLFYEFRASYRIFTTGKEYSIKTGDIVL